MGGGDQYTQLGTFSYNWPVVEAESCLITDTVMLGAGIQDWGLVETWLNSVPLRTLLLVSDKDCPGLYGLTTVDRWGGVGVSDPQTDHCGQVGWCGGQ